MSSVEGKGSRFLTAAIIFVSIAALFYFGYQAVSDNSSKTQKNPFEYNIKEYKQTDQNLLHYSELESIKINLDNLYGISISRDNKLYVSGESAILVLTLDGDIQSSIKTEAPARCLATDAKGDLYLGMGDHIEVYDAKGSKTTRLESLGKNAIITSVAVSEENVFIADAGNHLVWKFTRSGEKQAEIGRKNTAKDIPGFIIPSPYFDAAIDADGFLWVVNPGRHSLENYMDDGNLRSSWGEYSWAVDGFCGCCNPSHIAILDDGSFVTSEKGIVRVKVYNRLGNLVSVVAGPDQFAEGTVGLDLAVDSSQRIYVLDPFRKVVRVFKKNLKPDSRG